METIWQSEPHEFFQAVKNGAHLFHGITNATICHNEGWHFLRLGRFIERAVNTAALLNSHLTSIIERQQVSSEPLDYVELVGVLKSCTAFEAYCQTYTADVRPNTIAEFLLLSAECPRSVRFAVEMVQATLQEIARITRKPGRAERLAGRLHATLEYGQVDEIIADNLHVFLEDIQRRCTQIHTAIHQTYIAYPVDYMLAS
ncbi:MAG: alpha-E domain-containing protein [Acidobacteriota bacterium]|nr:alpha-E domain-containing protein [Acidobacteriota bacterium]